jgi:hypothetical protein
LFEATSGRLTEAYQSTTPTQAARRFDALQAHTILIDVDSETDQADPPWLDSPCFATGFRNHAWVVATRVEGACADD